jgi:hypothetical protein
MGQVGRGERGVYAGNLQRGGKSIDFTRALARPLRSMRRTACPADSGLRRSARVPSPNPRRSIRGLD